MYDLDSPDMAGGDDSPDVGKEGNDLNSRLNGLMSTLGRRTQERDDALARLADMENELAAARQLLDSRPEARITVPPNPMARTVPLEPDPRSITWGAVGLGEMHDRT